MLEKQEIGNRKRKARFEIEELFEDLLPQLKCFNCKATPGTSVPQRKRFKCFEKCHSLCENCNHGCPCGSKVGKMECGLTAKILEKFLPRQCPFFNAGCEQVLELDDYDGHLKKCDFRLVNCPSIECEEKIVFSKLNDHLVVFHGFESKYLFHCTSMNRWACDVRMKFGMEMVRNSFNQQAACKSFIGEFFKKLGAMATILAPQIKISFATCTKFENNAGNCTGGVLLQTCNDGPNFYFVGTSTDRFTHYYIYFSGSSDDAKKYSFVINVSGKRKDVFTFRGNVFPLVEDWKTIMNEQQDTMVIGLNAIQRLVDDDMYVNFEIIIRRDD